MKYNAPDFNLKWFVRFADNDDFIISEKDLRELAADIADSFASTSAPNVPEYQAGTFYAVGTVVLYRTSGIDRFYKALRPGYPPAPTGAQADVNWQPVAPPTDPTALSQTLPLDTAGYLARHPEYQALKAGLRFDIKGPWNNGAPDQVVSVVGTGPGFELSGSLLRAGVRTNVDVDVVAGTAVPAGQPLTAATTAITFLHHATLPTVSSATFTADPTGAVAGTVVFIWLGPGASRPDLSNPVFQLEPTAKYVTGKTHRYAFCVGGNGLIQYNITPF